MRTLHHGRRLGLSAMLVALVIVMSSASVVTPALATQFESPLLPTALIRRAYLPLIVRPIAACAPTGEMYGTLAPIDPAAGDVSQHPGFIARR